MHTLRDITFQNLPVIGPDEKPTWDDEPTQPYINPRMRATSPEIPRLKSVKVIG